MLECIIFLNQVQIQVIIGKNFKQIAILLDVEFSLYIVVEVTFSIGGLPLYFVYKLKDYWACVGLSGKLESHLRIGLLEVDVLLLEVITRVTHKVWRAELALFSQ